MRVFLGMVRVIIFELGEVLLVTIEGRSSLSLVEEIDEGVNRILEVNIQRKKQSCVSDRHV